MTARWSRLGLAASSWLFLAGVVAQLFLLGLHAFDAGVPESLHRDFAYTYGWLLPAMLVLGRLASASTALQASALTLLALYAVQTALPGLRESIPLFGPIHAVNALALFVLAILVAQRATRELRAGAAHEPRDAGDQGAATATGT